MKLSIIIPVYNEAATISQLISKVKKVKLDKIKKEIVVVNDKSTDNTLSILRKIKGIKVITHKKNKGKGGAVRTGFNSAEGDVLLIQDADLEYDPNDYKKLLQPILSGKEKVVYGSRLKNYPLIFSGTNKTPMPFHWVANKSLTFLTNILYGGQITDMETCYKIFKREVMKSFELTSDGFEIEVELTAKTLKKGFRIYEVPIKVKPRDYSEGKKISWKDGIKAVYYLLYFRFFD